jgi:FixJ family two-component response regulator
MSTPAVLIVDDEKNILLALALALEKLPLTVETADTGTAALQKIAAKSYGLLLLDLRLPDLDGMEILRRVAATRPEIKVIIITAYGSVDLAVEAMKLGAVDFLQKPFDTAEVRDMVSRVLDRETQEKQRGRDYDHYLDLADQRVRAGQFDPARVYAEKATFLDPRRPEAFNILGGLHETRGNRQEAHREYRVALELDPTYEPASRNLTRITSRPYTPLGIVWHDPARKGRKGKP